MTFWLGNRIFGEGKGSGIFFVFELGYFRGGLE